MEFTLGVTPPFCSRPVPVSSTLLQNFSPGKLELPIPSQKVFLFMLVHTTIVNIFFHFLSCKALPFPLFMNLKRFWLLAKIQRKQLVTFLYSFSTLLFFPLSLDLTWILKKSVPFKAIFLSEHKLASSGTSTGRSICKNYHLHFCLI